MKKASIIVYCTWSRHFMGFVVRKRSESSELLVSLGEFRLQKGLFMVITQWLPYQKPLNYIAAI